MKKIFSFLFFALLSVVQSFAAPSIPCDDLLPGCDGGAVGGDTGVSALGKIIGLLIQYTAVLAVICIMLSGIMYMISAGDEEKTKRAQKWITWSLLGTFVSISAWAIINIINNIV